LVLMHGFHKCQDSSTLLLTSYSLNSAILDVEGYEFVGGHIALNMDFVKVSGLSDVLDSLVEVTSPEEGHITKWHHLSKHVES
jgi:hypothetical protein